MMASEQQIEIMDRLGIAPKGDRVVDFELAEPVTAHQIMERQYGLTCDGFMYSLNGWIEKDETVEGLIMGERYVKTGRYIPDTSTPSTPFGPAEFSPAELSQWRTHRALLVVENLRKKPAYVLSDRIERR